MSSEDLTSRMRGEIRAEMARQGVTVQQVSSRCDLSVWALRRRLNGTSPLGFSDAVVIAEALNIPLHEMVARANRVAA